MLSQTALDDPKRLAAIEASGILDSSTDGAFERYTRLCAALLGAPVALLSVVSSDRQIFKSCLGLQGPWAQVKQTPLTHSFCQYVVTSHQALIVEDSLTDQRVNECLGITELGIGSYLGVPIRTPDGQIIGSLCAVDREPRQWRPEQLLLLEDLRDSLECEIALQNLERGNLTSNPPQGRLLKQETSIQLMARFEHELRTPLNALWNLSGELAEAPLESRWRELAETLKSKSHSLTHLLEDLLELAALRQGSLSPRPQWLESSELCRRILTELKPECFSAEPCTCQFPDDLPSKLFLDLERFSSILRHLLRFELDQGAEGHSSGETSGESLSRQEKGLELKVQWVDQCLQIEMQSPDPSSRTLHPLLTQSWTCPLEKIKVAALPLVIVQHHLKDLGGHAAVGSRPGSLKIVLPAPSGDQDKSLKQVEEGRPPIQRILVVDDDATNLRVVQHIAAKLDLTLACVNSGEAALELLEHEVFDLILLDLRMPGMDGFEVTRQIRDNLKLQTPIVAVTADNLQETRAETEKRGMSGFLPKPIRSRDLARVLRREPT